MPGLYQKIDVDMKAAMVAKDATRLGTLRFLKSALKYVVIEKKTESLADAEVLQIIQKQIKQHRESLEQFRKGGREDLALKEADELAVLESYVPAQLSDEEIKQLVEQKVKEAGATTKKDFGRVMKLLTEAVAGRAEPKRLSDCLGRILV